MSKAVKVTLMGKPFTLQTDEDEAHVQRVAALVDARVAELQVRASSLPPQSLALLAALTIADDLEKERAGHARRDDGLRDQVQRLRMRIKSAVGDA
jgi:cell division protein ZapA (FtsZ GTPase activity inhibitor)